ncbi:hypothetical protein [Streptomyces sp. NPDC059398]|uniref:hypothetical protein n=1 Tax=Streptomyces sp. NPDC059398 TaxID=3346820 RepID=UPI0036C821A2
MAGIRDDSTEPGNAVGAAASVRLTVPTALERRGPVSRGSGTRDGRHAVTELTEAGRGVLTDRRAGRP